MGVAPLGPLSNLRKSNAVSVGLRQRAQTPTVLVQDSYSASFQAKATAYALGTIRPQEISGAAGFSAMARAEVQASGRAEVGELIKASADGKITAEVGASADAKGHLKFGLDSLGLPSIDAEAGAEAMTGAQATGDAHGNINLLNLVEIDLGASAKAIAGAAAAIVGGFSFKDGKLRIKSGATAAAGAGVSGQAEVGVGLGKIPRGALQTTVKPFLAVPTLTLTTLYKGVAALFGEHPDVPDLTDLPKTVATAVSDGAKSMVDGVVGIGEQIGDAAKGIGNFFKKLF